MKCPACRADAVPPFCGHCGAPLSGTRVVDTDIPEGRRIMGVNLAKSPPPGRDTREGTIGSSSWAPGDDGIAVHVPKGRVVFFSDPQLRLREAVVRTHFTASTDTAAAGCVARQEVVGDGEVELFFEVHPGQGRARLGRRFNIGTSAQIVELAGWFADPAIPPVGQRVEAELRVRGPVLQGWVGGKRILESTDSILTTGRCGIRVSGQGGDARLTLHGFGVWTAGSGT